MKSGSSIIAALIATAALTSMTLAASAQESVEPEGEAATSTSVTGLITREADPDGQVTYYVVPSEGDPMPLRFGPPWFWGPLNPLDALVDQTVTLEGRLSEAISDEDASEAELAQAPVGPSLLVVAADGATLRQQGKPP